MKITSTTNPKIKNLLKLRKPSERRASGLILIDGAREVRSAVIQGVEIKEIYLCPELLSNHVKQSLLPRLQMQKSTVYEVPAKIFEKIAFGERQEGIMAVARPKLLTLKDFKASTNPFLLVVEAVEKPGNLGAILRTADAVAVDAVFVLDPAVDIYNANVIRASLGAIFSVPVIAAQRAEMFDFLKRAGIAIIAATPSGKSSYTEIDFRRPSAIVVGSEKDGLGPFWSKAADEMVYIPMKGQVDSLNASVACAVMAYEALRQRDTRFSS